MRQIIEIYETVRKLGFCRNQEDFSTDWLGHSRSYLGYLKSTGSKPSLAASGMLSNKLRSKVDGLRETGPTSDYRQLRAAFVSAQTIYNACYEIQHIPRELWITAF